jgi:thiosulfate dehydrogenase
MNQHDLLKFSRWLSILSVVVVLGFVGCLYLLSNPTSNENLFVKKGIIATPEDSLWIAPDTLLIPKKKQGELIRYGRDLIAHTAKYLGPKGSVKQISNGMNCQNCHLNAGTKPFGNNYGSVAATYPKFRARSGSIESIEKRVNDCIERSLNGIAIDSLSREMRAMVAYISWLGKDMVKGNKAKGSGLIDLTFLDRAADPTKGQVLYEQKCLTCHGKKGEGLKRMDGIEYLYPPLWGEHSFNVGAGLYRISNLAKYMYANMPLGATFYEPLLTNEEAWDIAGYVVSLERPKKTFPHDWPKIESKPIDHPFGPYSDNLTEKQHKFGPFK